MDRKGFVAIITTVIIFILVAATAGYFAWEKGNEKLSLQIVPQQTTSVASSTVISTTVISTSTAEGCTLLPYKGTKPLNQLEYYSPGNEDFRGGMICRFIINPKLPVFIFHFTGQEDNNLGNVDITEGNDPKIIQTITYNTDPNAIAPEAHESILVPVDANFDGYKDLPILTQCGATGNCTYDFYLYNPRTSRFLENSFLSGIGTFEINSPKQQITSSGNGSVYDWATATYQYQNGQYTLIRKTISVWDRSSSTITVQAYELRGGKMELINSTTTSEYSE